MKAARWISLLSVVLVAGCGGAGSNFDKLTIATQPKAISAKVGTNASLSVVANGTGPLTYQWYQDSTKITDGTTSSIAFSPLVKADGGSYYVEVTDDSGTISSETVTVTVTD